MSKSTKKSKPAAKAKPSVKAKPAAKAKPVAKAKASSKSKLSVSKSKVKTAAKSKARPVAARTTVQSKKVVKAPAKKGEAKKADGKKPLKEATKKSALGGVVLTTKSSSVKAESRKPTEPAKPAYVLPKLTKPMDPRMPVVINKLTRMPISQEGNLNAIKKAKKQDPHKTRYTDKELKEFKEIILNKLEESRKELALLQAQITNANEHGTDDTAGTFKVLEDGSDTLAKEEAGQMAARQRKFIEQLEGALGRIENKTYGICRVTGKLIPKERLRAVPHTTQSIEAKLNQYRD